MRVVGRAWHFACLASSGMGDQMYDFVVVGGGSAGCVIASRLTEDPDIRVLLVEAGGARGPDAMTVPALWPMLIGTPLDWGSRTVPQRELNGGVLAYPRGRVLGGSSSINAMAFLRAHPRATTAGPAKALTAGTMRRCCPTSDAARTLRVATRTGAGPKGR